MTSEQKRQRPGRTDDLPPSPFGATRPGSKPAVLFIGCHPDDIELGAGGTVCRFVRAGYPVKLIYLTKGEFGCSPRMRQAESRAACCKLGVRHKTDIIFGRFPDTRVPNNKRLLDFIEEQYLDGKPCERHLRFPVFAAFIHSSHDVHQDHRIAHEWCVTALRHVHKIYAFEAPSYTDAFSPTTFVDITDVFEQKADALACHKSQLVLQRPYMEYEAIKNVARFRGVRIGVPFAEAFETLKNSLDA